MSKLTKLVILPLLFVLWVAAVAQNTQPAANMLQQMSQQLNLTPDQKDKLKPILEQEGQQLEAVRNDTSLTPRQQMMKAKSIKQSYQPKIDSILTPEQQEKLKQMKQEAAQHMREKQAAAQPK